MIHLRDALSETQEAACCTVQQRRNKPVPHFLESSLPLVHFLSSMNPFFKAPCQTWKLVSGTCETGRTHVHHNEDPHQGLHVIIISHLRFTHHVLWDPRCMWDNSVTYGWRRESELIRGGPAPRCHAAELYTSLVRHARICVLDAEWLIPPARCCANRVHKKQGSEWLIFSCCTSHHCNYTAIVLWQGRKRKKLQFSQWNYHL